MPSSSSSSASRSRSRSSSSPQSSSSQSSASTASQQSSQQQPPSSAGSKALLANIVNFYRSAPVQTRSSKNAVRALLALGREGDSQSTTQGSKVSSSGDAAEEEDAQTSAQHEDGSDQEDNSDAESSSMLSRDEAGETPVQEDDDNEEGQQRASIDDYDDNNWPLYVDRLYDHAEELGDCDLYAYTSSGRRNPPVSMDNLELTIQRIDKLVDLTEVCMEQEAERQRERQGDTPRAPRQPWKQRSRVREQGMNSDLRHTTKSYIRSSIECKKMVVIARVLLALTERPRADCISALTMVNQQFPADELVDDVPYYRRELLRITATTGLLGNSASSNKKLYTYCAQMNGSQLSRLCFAVADAAYHVHTAYTSELQLLDSSGAVPLSPPLFTQTSMHNESSTATHVSATQTSVTTTRTTRVERGEAFVFASATTVEDEQPPDLMDEEDRASTHSNAASTVSMELDSPRIGEEDTFPDPVFTCDIVPLAQDVDEEDGYVNGKTNGNRATQHTSAAEDEADSLRKVSFNLYLCDDEDD
ncbi:hypothetical protein RI367_003916 [Sorochytrium milnesiophthora]